MSQLRTWDPFSLIITYVGAQLQGFALDSMIKVKFNTPAVALAMGAQGTGVRSIARDLSAKFTLTLQASSPSNDLLMSQWLLDRGTPPIGAGEFMFKHLNGTSFAHCESAWVEEVPEVDFGKDAKDREWVLETDTLELFVGGMVA